MRSDVYRLVEAVDAIALEQPDLVVLDIMLGEGPIDGYQVARRVREFSDVPIIMLTARVEDNDKIVGLEIGADR